MKERVKRLREVKEGASTGGGPAKIAMEHEKGKLSARELINLLLDPESFNEFNMLVKYRIGAPGDGIVVGHGTIGGRRVCVFSHDAAVMGGSQGYMHGRKLYKIHEMALEMGAPLIGLNNSPGARVVRPDVVGSDDPYRVNDEKIQVMERSSLKGKEEGRENSKVLWPASLKGLASIHWEYLASDCHNSDKHARRVP